MKEKNLHSTNLNKIYDYYTDIKFLDFFFHSKVQEFPNIKFFFKCLNS